jgi:hypothetical protein
MEGRNPHTAQQPLLIGGQVEGFGHAYQHRGHRSRLKDGRTEGRKDGREGRKEAKEAKEGREGRKERRPLKGRKEGALERKEDTKVNSMK